MKTKLFIIIGLIFLNVSISNAMKVHQDTDFTGEIITNISAAYATTGTFIYVPEASDRTGPLLAND